MFQLVRPAEAYRESYLQSLQEAHAEGRLLHLDYDALSADFGAFVQELLDKEEPEKVLPGRVAESIYWLVKDDNYIGRVSVRHMLNDYLWQVGGHIGYDIRPSERRKGYGKQILELALPKARDLGLKQILITCDNDNIASQKIIEANGGLFAGEYEVEEQETPIMHYWIEL
jgi:predicted acetyltransferase